MSDTAPPENNKDKLADPDTPALSSSPAEATASRRPAGARPLIILALLLALAALALAAWSAWQLQQQRQSAAQQSARLEQVNAQAREQMQQGEQLAARMGELPQRSQLDEQRRLILTLQGDQQNLAQALSQAMGQSRAAWRLTEAEHLVRLAMLRLSALHDTVGAIELLQTADDIVRAQNDPLSYAAREELIQALEALRSLPQPDRSGLFLQLGALRGQADKLQSVVPEFVVDADSRQIAVDASQRPWWDWQRWRDTLSQYVRLDLNAQREVKPLLAGETLGQVRLSLSLALEQAQWGALNANGAVYQQAVRQATAVLEQYFDPRNAEVQAMQRRLGQLSGQVVEVTMPDLRNVLTRLENYVSEREKANQAPETEKSSDSRDSEAPS